jgi:hypothetical protein
MLQTPHTQHPLTIKSKSVLKRRRFCDFSMTKKNTAGYTFTVLNRGNQQMFPAMVKSLSILYQAAQEPV